MGRVLLRPTAHRIELALKRLDAVGVDVHDYRVLYNDFRDWLLLLGVLVLCSFPLVLALEHFAGRLL
jgi:hypothetical protein